MQSALQEGDLPSLTLLAAKFLPQDDISREEAPLLHVFSSLFLRGLDSDTKPGDLDHVEVFDQPQLPQRKTESRGNQ